MPGPVHRWSCMSCREVSLNRFTPKRCSECGARSGFEDRGRAYPFQIKRKRCRTCGDVFRVILDRAGRPKDHCKRCRKDYMLYPGAMRKLRQEIAAGRETSEAYKLAMRGKLYRRTMKAIARKRIGVPEIERVEPDAE